MKHQAIINLKYAIYPVNHDEMLPTQKTFVKALKIIPGNSLEDCNKKVKEFLKDSNFSITHEVKENDNRN